MQCPLKRCQEIIGYNFNDIMVLQEALTHASYSMEAGKNNERLEFLGDAILGLVISEYLYTEFPETREGDMTQMKSFIVSRSTLALLARKIGLRECIHLGKGISRRTRLPDSVYANAFEAIFAGIYLDGGLDAAKKVIVTLLHSDIHSAHAKTHQPNYKSILQQYTQRSMQTTPKYNVIEEKGPDHGKVFTVVANIKGKTYPSGKGFSKKEAEQQSARRTLAKLGVDPFNYKTSP